MRSASALVLAAALSSAACGVPGQSSADRITDEDVPFGLLESADTPVADSVAAASGETRTATIYLVRQERLVAAERALTAQGVPALTRALLAGPNDDEAAEGIRSALVDAEIVTSVTVRAGVATFDLAPTFSDSSAAEQRLALAQLTFTATEDPDVRMAAFTLDGEPTSAPRDDGTTSDGPVTREDYASLTPAAP